MYQKKNMVLNGLVFALGLAMVVWSAVTDNHSFLGGVGGGLMGVTGMRLLLGLRYRTDEDYAREVDTNSRDERNQFIARQAQAWSFTLTIILLSLTSILLRFVHQEAASLICSWILCGMLVVDWVLYYILWKKY